MRKSIGIALLLGTSALTSTAAFAQAPASDASAVNEIVVTAQNRVQNVQEVPIRIDVVNAEQLAEAGFSDANDLGKIAPVAMIQQDQGTVQVTLRGVGNTAGGNTDNSVVTNIDGEYLNSPAALGVALFDLERVEVLRGPQGTLYGRNATGGAVNFIMRKPGDRWAGNYSLSYGNYESVRADAGMDFPLADGVGMRFAGFAERRAGYVKHPGLLPSRLGPFAFPGYTGGRSDDNEAFGGRLSLNADHIGGSGLSVYLAGELSHREFTPQVFTFVDTHQPAYTPGANCARNPGWSRTAPLIVGETLCIPNNTHFLDNVKRDEYPVPLNGVGRQYWDTAAYRGRIDYDFGPAATLSYIGGWRSFERDPRSTGSLPVIYANLVDHNRNETQSHELRLAGVVSGITYQIGGFYFKEDVENLGGFYLGDITPGGNNFGFYINYNLRDSKNVSKSLFGQVEVPLGSKLTAVGGLRYTDNTNKGYWRDKKGQFNGIAYRAVNDTNFTAPLFLLSEQDKVTWLAGLNYKPDIDTLFYAKVSTGFKAGGFDAVGNYGPETNTAYEAGMKKNFGDRGQHILNLGAFYYDYKGLQVDVLLSSAEGGRVFNAGSAENYGFEAETSIALTDNDHINATLNYLHAELKQLNALYNVYCVPIAEGGQGTCGNDSIAAIGDLDPNTPGIQSPSFAGNRPAYAPRWIFTLGYDHDWRMSSGTVTFRVNTTFKSKYYTSFLNYPDESQDAYTSTDIGLDYRADSGLSVSAFMRNIENKRPLTQAYFLAAGPDDIWNWQFGSPRLYGVRLGYEF